MEWFYVDPERKTRGPHALEKLVELFRAGEINGETLIWTKDMPDWAPAKSCQDFFNALRTLKRPADQQPPPLPPALPDAPPLSDAPVQLDVPLDLVTPVTLAADSEDRLHAVEPAVAMTNPFHPWRRFFARQLDIGLVAILLGFCMELFFPRNPAVGKLLGSNVVIGMLTVLLLVPFETILLAVFGTTFGKALYSIEVKSSSPAPLSFATSFNRAFSVYLRGLALGFPLISLFTVYMGYRTLKKNGIASWDADNDLEVSHRPIGYVRIAVIAFIWLLYIGLVAYGISVGASKKAASNVEPPQTGKRAASNAEPPQTTKPAASNAEPPQTTTKSVEQIFGEAENKIRPTLPLKIDGITTLVGISHAGNTLMYSYVLEFDRTKNDPQVFQANMERVIKEKVCATAGLLVPLNAGGRYTYIYNDTQSLPVALIKMSADDCK